MGYRVGIAETLHITGDVPVEGNTVEDIAPNVSFQAIHEDGCSGRHVGRYNDVCLCRGWVWVMADGWPICKAQPSRAKALHVAQFIAPSIGEGAAQGRYMLIHVES